MADAWKRLYQGQPGTSAAELYDVPDGFAAIIKHAEIVNVHASSSDVITLWILPPAVGATADQYIWLPATSLAPGERLTFNGSLSLEADCAIWADVADGAELNVLITGMEVDV
jgi:hypothetical protein